MASGNELLTRPQADARRRIHIWRFTDCFGWAFGPTGHKFKTETAGQALDEAIEQIGHQPAVIIYEGRAG